MILNYTETLAYIFQKLPMFSRIGAAAMKPDLNNIISLCEVLNHPEKNFKSIHIAGTNGKGSTSHMLAAVLQNEGYKVGLYTSPHLIDFRERIRINGTPVSESFVVSFVQSIQTEIERIQPSFFEITVAMAFQYFKEESVDFAIIETGLGGRLDSTNIIEPILSIITNISFDHKDLLGDTLEKIAKEKAGIIKPKIPVLIGQYQDGVDTVFFQSSIQNKSTLYHADSIWDLVKINQTPLFQKFKAIHRTSLEFLDISTDLMGEYQRHNIKTVLSAIEILNACYGFDLSMFKATQALNQVKKLTGFRGRWEIVSRTPFIVLDVAHNIDGLTLVMHQLSTIQASKKHIVLGFVKDKEVDEVLSLFPKDAIYYCTQASIPRALSFNELFEKLNKHNLVCHAYPNVASALRAAKDSLVDNDLLLVTGSFFVVGEAMSILDAQKV